MQKFSIFALLIILTISLKGQNKTVSANLKPINATAFSEGLRIERKLDWGYFNNETLDMVMHFPNDPFAKKSILSNQDSSKTINITHYFVNDSINQISYSIKAGKIDTLLWSMKEVIDIISATPNFQLISQKKESFFYNETTILEFYVGSGLFRRYHIIMNNNVLTILFTESTKRKIYSDLAQYFFSGIYLNGQVQFQKLIENKSKLTLEITGSILHTNKDTVQAYQIYVATNNDTTYFDFLNEKRFKVSLTLGHKYTIGFKKDGFMRKHITANLIEHGTFTASQYGFGFPMDLTLLPGDVQSPSKHVANLRYNPFTGFIDHK